MFTGIIREKGVIRRLDAAGGLYALEISCSSVRDGAGVGDSIAVNGVCLTVTKKMPGALRFDVMAETVRRTALAGSRAGEEVNLEGSLKAGGSLDGHFVQGHIDCVGTVKEIVSKEGEYAMTVEFPPDFDRLVVEKGSIALDGVSLTVGGAGRGSCSVYIIPHTLNETTLGSKRRGSAVNIEFDIIGKYVDRYDAARRSGITETFLKDRGFA